ncbi:Lrp/AsnC family transcriptional regulator [Polaromonas sp. C04]|uniref:Lrp/AsnC family transcriptional regulator n=1 Tax=Polaromonas sp. C04 TaxID=1945857 RepID=UPI0009847042|nr:Lrp/AsnC family transcriptional regulator [Polaromonas sp. C04]OOG54748.1 AsnC family transcriptional regulator [Polaromonas sp. C04]
MNADPVLLDANSLKILFELQRDARQTVQQISEAVGLSATPCWKRIKEMEAAGVIRGYTAVVDREKVGLMVAAVTEVNLERHSESQVQRFEEAVAASPQIVRCVSATGPADYILTVLVPDMKHYEQFLHETLFKLPGVTHVRSSIVLRDVKSEVALPIEQVPLPSASPARTRRR